MRKHSTDKRIKSNKIFFKHKKTRENYNIRKGEEKNMRESFADMFFRSLGVAVTYVAVAMSAMAFYHQFLK